jgi:Zn-dependent protease
MSQPPSAPTATLKSSQKPPWIQRHLITVVALALGIASGFASALIPESMGSIGAGELAGVLASAFFLSILSHECGHLVAAWLVRFEVSAFVIGPFGLYHKPDGWKFMLNKHLGAVLGFVGIRPRSYERIHRRLSIFILGGPLGNLAAAGVCGLLLMQPQNPLPAHLYLQTAGVCLLIGALNCIPYKSHSVQSDGARLLMLRRRPQEAERWVAVIALDSDLQRGVRPREWDAAAVTLATSSPDQSVDHYTGMLRAYLWAEDRDDYDQAQTYLDHLLASHPQASPYHQAVILAEGAFFYSYHRHNLYLARDCWERLKPLEQQVTRQTLAHTRTTLLAAEGRLDEAREHLQEYLRIRKEPLYAWTGESEAKWLVTMRSALNLVEAQAKA